MMDRRHFIQSGSLALAGCGLVPGFLHDAVSSEKNSSGGKILLIVTLRGGADGLNLVPPFADPHYRVARPAIAIAEPKAGSTRAAIDLDGYFGLHPALRPLDEYFRAGKLAIVQAVGSPDNTRSHIHAWERTELGPCLRRANRRIYPAADSFMEKTVGTVRPCGEDRYPESPFGESLRRIARRIKADAGLEVAFAESLGWDHHADEGGIDGALARRATDLARGLVAFCRDLEKRMEDIVIVTISEFGRTVRENDHGGTDHGHGGVMFLLGGPVRGGRVVGHWPGLAQEQLFEGRDLALTSDFRDVINEVCIRHLSCEVIQPLFPQHTPTPENFPGLFST